ncbi:uncharacterized protein ycf23-like [Zingiber officinale]|uniref:uncharacterized protein ycf23-like n=1 Tax=Zingiber officinale TaxID=94328 RepID=UPI001C4D6A4B|nr:uncharacterized protein ycf23-like [Zingiber officinale]
MPVPHLFNEMSMWEFYLLMATWKWCYSFKIWKHSIDVGSKVARIFRVPQLFFLMMILFLQICVSSVDPLAFPSAVEAGAQMVEIGNYDSFYEMGIQFSPEQILKLTRETRRILPSITLSVTVPHMLSLPDQVKLAELLEQEGADIIQTEGGKYSSPSKPGVLGLIEKATPTLAAAYSISRAVQIPVMCSSGLSAVTAPMALTAGAAGVVCVLLLSNLIIICY